MPITKFFRFVCGGCGKMEERAIGHESDVVAIPVSVSLGGVRGLYAREDNACSDKCARDVAHRLFDEMLELKTKSDKINPIDTLGETPAP